MSDMEIKPYSTWKWIMETEPYVLSQTQHLDNFCAILFVLFASFCGHTKLVSKIIQRKSRKQTIWDTSALLPEGSLLTP